MTLQQLAYFLAAADRGSFNAAARALHCSQPAVSEQVRRLEDELGVTLFTRAGRGLALTRSGRRFRPHAERVLAASEDAAAAVGRGGLARERVVTLGVFRNAPYYRITDLVTAFHAAQGGRGRIRLRLPGQNSAETAAAVRAGELEAGLVVLPVDDGGLDVHLLFRDEVLYLSAAPERVRRPAGIRRVARAPLVLYDAAFGFADPTRRQLAARAQEAGVRLAPEIEVEHVETALQLVARGVGDTLAARAVTRTSSFPPGVRGVGFSPPLYDSFALVTRAGAHLSPGVRSAVDAVLAWAPRVAAELGDQLPEAATGAPAGADTAP